MPKFAFQLDGLLRHRELEEQQRQRELAVVQAEMRKLEEVLRGVDEEMRTSMLDLKENRLVGRLDLNFLAAHRRYAIAVQRKVTQIAEQMATQKRKVEEAQRALAEAAKQRKMIERLRERRKQEWAADQARREFAELDDVTTRLAAWPSAGAGGAEPEGHAP